MTIQYPIANLNDGLLNGVAGAIGSFNAPAGRGPSGPKFTCNPVNWFDVNIPSSTTLTTNFQRISGINVPIELEITASISIPQLVFVNRLPTTVGAHEISYVTNTTSARIIVQPDMFLAFRFFSTATATRTASVYNYSDMRTLLDTFTFTFTISGGTGGG